MLREKDELTGSVSGEARECESRSQRVRVVLLVLSRECGPRERERERESVVSVGTRVANQLLSCLNYSTLSYLVYVKQPSFPA